MRWRTTIAVVAAGLALVACVSTSDARGPTTFARLATARPQPEITVDDPATACTAWSLIWPTIDEVTITGDLDPLSILLATGGQRQAVYALTDWATSQLSTSNATALSDDVDVAMRQMSSLTGGDSTTSLRAAAQAVNTDCTTT